VQTRGVQHAPSVRYHAELPYNSALKERFGDWTSSQNSPKAISVFQDRSESDDGGDSEQCRGESHAAGNVPVKKGLVVSRTAEKGVE